MTEPIRYRSVMKAFPIAALAIITGLLLAPVRVQQATPPEQNAHSASAPQARGMMNGDKMPDRNATDGRFDAQTQKMLSARGGDKMLAMQALLASLVQQQVIKHGNRSMMHTMMMSQMPHQEVSK